MRKKIKVGSKELVVDGKMCNSFFSRLRGLMFRFSLRPMIFVFPRNTRMSIHSFFVFRKFLAIWLLNGRVVDMRVVKPWSFTVAAKGKYDTLVEIPFTRKGQISKFLDGDSLEKGLNTK